MHDLRKIFADTDRPSAEKYFSTNTRSQYVGGNSLLCQILGSKKLFVIGDDVGFSPHMIFDGYWEFWLSKYFARVVRPGDTVLDIGANQGYYTILSADLVSDTGKVIAIEPNPEVFKRLVASINVNGYSERVEAKNVALSLGGQSGQVPFYVPTGETKNGRFVGEFEIIEDLRTTGNVFDVKLGAIEPDHFERLDFIKIDVEGAELAVLDHLRPAIARHQPGIVCEINFARMGYGYDDVVAALGTDDLLFLDYDSITKPFTREMADSQRLGEDWLICIERGR